MKRGMDRGWLSAVCALLVAALLSGCASRDSLGEYGFRGQALSGRMRTPPEPRVFADYSLRLDRNDPVGSAIRVGTSIAKAAEVQRAQERMERALYAVDLPEEIRRTTLDECADVLGCGPVERAAGADFVLDLEIREYGIDARSWNSQAEFRVDLSAVLRDGEDGREIWRAHVRERSPITPALFGLGGAVGNIVSAFTLSELSEEDIGRGLMRLAGNVASRAADRLERDLWRAREG